MNLLMIGMGNYDKNKVPSDKNTDCIVTNAYAESSDDQADLKRKSPEPAREQSTQINAHGKCR